MSCFPAFPFLIKNNLTPYTRITLLYEWRNHGSKIIYKVPVRRLTNIIEENISLLDKEFHFCKIDVEGFEKTVLEGIDFKTIRPWIFVIESTKPGTAISTYEEWEYILLNAGYKFVHEYGINRYYLEESKAELKERFLSLAHLSEIYDVFKCIKPQNEKNGYDIRSNFYYKVGKIVTFPLIPLRPIIKRLLY